MHCHDYLLIQKAKKGVLFDAAVFFYSMIKKMRRIFYLIINNPFSCLKLVKQPIVKKAHKNSFRTSVRKKRNFNYAFLFNLSFFLI
jgi:hypothetical protein